MKSFINFKRFALILFCLISVYAQGQTEKPEYVPGQVLVKMKANKTITQKNILKNEMKASTRRTRPNSNIEVWQTDKSNIHQLVSQYRNHPDIEFIEPNYYYYLATENRTKADKQEDIIPGDALFTDLWGMNNTGQDGGTPDADIDASEGWDIATGSPSVVVGLIDTGVDWKHPDLVNNIWQNLGEDADGDGRVLEQNANGVWIFDPGDINGIDDDGNGYPDDFIGWDFIDNDNDPFDIIGHGTHVAGTLGAEGNNGIGVAGVTWEVQIAALRVFAQQNTPVDIIAEALDYAVAMNMPISNNSYAEGRYAETMITSLQTAQTNGHLFVAAAGNFKNDNDANPNYPSSYDFDNIISVAATDRDDLLWVQSTGRGSSYGATNVDIAAPGANIRSTTPGDTYGYNTGTSMATPHVAGACALLWEQNPNETYAEIKTALLSSVDILPDLNGKSVSEGRLNLHGALIYFNATPPPTGCRYNDSLALVALYDVNNLSWDLTQVIDTWSGVTLNEEGCVSELNLSYYQVSSLPPEIGDLTNLSSLFLHYNSLVNLPAEIGNLTNLSSLDLHYNSLVTLPAGIGNLTNLSSLSLYNNSLTTLPAEIGNLTNLSSLNLWNNNLTTLPPEIGDLTNLSTLHLAGNNLTILPAEIGDLMNLSTLDLYINSLMALPPEFGDLTNLSSLYLNNNNLTTLPAEFGNLTNLSTLNLRNNNLTTLPPEIGSLTNLSTLYLNNNNLTTLPAEFGDLINLSYLDFSSNDLMTLPPEFGNLANLRNLYLPDNNLTTLPVEIGNLMNLSTLTLRNNSLTTLPAEIGDLTNLSSLDLISNSLTTLPAEIGDLTNLGSLALNSNNLTTLPAEIGDLANLSQLLLFNSNLTTLPPEIGNLTNLSHLDFRNNAATGCFDANLITLCNSIGISSLIDSGNNFDATWSEFCSGGVGACSVPTCRQSDSLALVALYNSTNGVSWTNTWNLNQSMDNWYGVTLNGFGCVIELDIEYNQLVGNIPTELGNLSNLTYLGLRGNQLINDIPPELGNLSHLEFLYLNTNQLTGSIPLEIGNLSDLERLSLANNQLTGSIPPELGNLSNLRELTLDTNQLNGNIPSEIGNLGYLTILWLNDNQLNGCYDENLSNLCNQLSPTYNTNAYFSDGNNFNAPWEDFCNIGAGTCALVWPGDYNYDGTANEIDALYWGLAFGHTGYIRPNATTAWQGQDAPDWTIDVEGINSKHQDGNGNGIVDAPDLQVVDDNFGNIHAYTQSVFIASTMIYELVEAGPVSGDPSYDLYVTDASGNNISAHGLAGAIDFGDISIDEVTFYTTNSSLIPSNTLEVFDDVENRFHFALTRTDGINQLCNGPVANFIVVTQDIPAGDSLVFSIENGNTVQANGDLARVAGTTLYSNYPSNIASNDLMVSASVVHEQCNVSGAVTLFVEGGTLPYSYVWNTGATSSSITGLTPNIYEVTVTDAANMSETLSVEVQGQYIAIPDEFGNLPDCTNSLCPTLLTPSGIVSTGTYKAGTAVNSDGTVNGNVTFKAGETIILRGGFEVPANTDFSGTIEECDEN